jgi:hypothetical protein
VEVTIHTPAPPHRDAARLRTEPLIPCRRNQLKESTSAIRAYGCIILGDHKLFLVKPN